ncbi:hypothetical protein IMCC1989_930 [gamma proteobacterium IMCC1989]|nr:hypothetical protein IMCC1989_930 [gamma proteobacterium IMCC1989]
MAALASSASNVPYRRVRAHSIGGSTYDAFNSSTEKTVLRTDATTKKKTIITGGDMEDALAAGVRSGNKHATALNNQASNFESGRKTTNHHPLGCAEARAEMAIAAHHIMNKTSALDDDGFEPVGKSAIANAYADNAWKNSGGSTYSNAVDQRNETVKACATCSARGFPDR